MPREIGQNCHRFALSDPPKYLSNLMIFLLGGWTKPFEKICTSNWIISPNKGEHEKYLKPPPSLWLESCNQKAGIWNRALASFASWIPTLSDEETKRRGVLFLLRLGEGTQKNWIFFSTFFLEGSVKRQSVFFLGFHPLPEKNLDGYLDERRCFYHLDSFAAPMFWNVPVIWGIGDDGRWPHICRLFPPKLTLKSPKKQPKCFNMCRMQSSTSTGFIQSKFLVNFHTLPGTQFE